MSIKWIYSGLLLIFLSYLSACYSDQEANLQAKGNNEEITMKSPLSEESFADLSEDFVDWVKERQDKDEIPGVAIALISSQREEVVVIEVFGKRDLKKQLPVTPDTLFHIGSTQKSMTALLIATLVDEGIVDWDTTVINIDPEFELGHADTTETVTLRHLLSMRSGIPDWAEDEFDLDNSEAEDIFDYLAEVELLGAPGEAFSYSNLAVSLGGYLAVLAIDPEEEDLYEGYRELLQERILGLIGMESSTIYASEAKRNPNYSRSYIVEDGELFEAETEDFDGDPLAPAGSLKASITDMASYISTQLNGGISPNGTLVVSEENLQQTHQPKWGNYGMGWEVSRDKGIELLSHGGAYDNFTSIIAIIPEYELGFVILTNSEENALDLIEQAPRKLIDLLVEASKKN